MLTVDHYARIRRAYRDGMSIGEIARRFHHSRRKIREVVRGGGEPKGYSRKLQHYRRLWEYLGVIEAILSEDEGAPRKQRHTAMRIFERLKAQGVGSRPRSTARHRSWRHQWPPCCPLKPR